VWSLLYRSQPPAKPQPINPPTTTAAAVSQVEELFSTGDLPRVAELLRSMGRSLALVGGVPEFRCVRLEGLGPGAGMGLGWGGVGRP